MANEAASLILFSSAAGFGSNGTFCQTPRCLSMKLGRTFPSCGKSLETICMMSFSADSGDRNGAFHQLEEELRDVSVPSKSIWNKEAFFGKIVVLRLSDDVEF